jgi:hypothetical protein
VKIAFDEHIAIKVVEGFKSFATIGALAAAEFVSARDYVEDDDEPNTDVPWLRRFRDNGGTVVISGDKKMRGRPHERSALIECGFIVFFCHPSWNKFQLHEKVARLINLWPQIEEKIVNGQAGDFWELPHAWSGEFRDVKGPQ